MSVTLNKSKSERIRKKADQYMKLIQSDEPVIELGKNIDRWSLIKLVSWYHQNYTGEDGRQWLIDYTEQNHPELIEQAKVGKLYYIQPCAYARLSLRGGVLPVETQLWLKNFISNMALPETKPKENLKVQLAVQAKKARSEERADQFGEFLADYEKDYDNLILGKKSELDVQKQLQSLQPTGTAVRDFVRTLKERLKELKEAFKKNSDMAEAYKYPRMRLRAFEDHYTRTIEICDNYIKGGGSVKKRKARATKYVPAEKIVSKVQVNTGSIFGIKTFSPKDVLDATAVVIYNNKYNQMTLLVAEKGKLSIKGTTIQGYSEKESMRKRVKKPQETLTKVHKAINTNAIVNIFKEIKNQPSAVTGRLNEDSYIIRVF